MSIAMLNIRSEQARLNLSITKPQLNLNSENGKMERDSAAAVVEIHSTSGQLQIDSYPWRYSALNMRNSNDFADDVASAGKQGFFDSISKFTSHGNSLVAPPSKGGMTIADIAAQEFIDPMPEVDFVATEKPTISYTPGSIDIQVRPPTNNARYLPAQFDLKLERGSVTGHVDPQQSINQWITMNKYDIYA